jgi:hypothetical protein
MTINPPVILTLQMSFFAKTASLVQLLLSDIQHVLEGTDIPDEALRKMEEGSDQKKKNIHLRDSLHGS